jgi:collagen type I alpha
MLSSVSGPNDLWAQLAAIRAAQSASAFTFGQGGTSPATAATTPPADAAPGSTVTATTTPMLSSGLLSQLLSLGGVFGGGANGTSGITRGSGSSGVGFPGGAPSFPPPRPSDVEAGSGSIANLFADLQSLGSNLGGSLASAGTTDAASTTGASNSTDASGTINASSTTSASNATAASLVGTGGTIDLSAALLQELQSISADLGGNRAAQPGAAVGGTVSSGLTVPPDATGNTSGDSTASNDTNAGGIGSGTGSTSTAASPQSPTDLLMQQIAQAVTADMQSFAGGGTTLGTSPTSISV